MIALPHSIFWQCLLLLIFCNVLPRYFQHRDDKEHKGIIVLGSAIDLHNGFSVACIGPFTLPNEAKRLYKFVPQQAGPAMGFNLFMLNDRQVSEVGNRGSTVSNVANIHGPDDIQEAFRVGGCSTVSGNPLTNVRYQSPSIYDWAPYGESSTLDFTLFATGGLGFRVDGARNLLLEVHYEFDNPPTAHDESRLLVGWDDISPSRSVKTIALKDGNPRLRITAGSIGVYQSKFITLTGGAVVSYHSHCHYVATRLCIGTWLELIDPAGRVLAQLYRLPREDPSERFVEIDPPLLATPRSTLSIKCMYNASLAKEDIVDPVEMCLFYLHVEESFEIDLA